MLLEEIAKAGRNSSTRGGNTVVDSLTMSKPQSVNCHRMTSLKTVSILVTEVTEAASRPREQGLEKSDRASEAEVLAEIRPDLLGERA